MPGAWVHSGAGSCQRSSKCGATALIREDATRAWMFSPKGSVHQFSNPHRETARALVVMTPDIGAQYFREFVGVINHGGQPDRGRADLRNGPLRFGSCDTAELSLQSRRRARPRERRERYGLVFSVAARLAEI